MPWASWDRRKTASSIVLLALARDAQVDAYVRSAAARALGQLGRAQDKVLDGLLALARDAQVDASRALTRRRVRWASWGGRKKPPRSCWRWRGMRRSPPRALRGGECAGPVGAGGEAAEVLLAVARDAQVTASVRSAAARALGQLGRAEDKVIEVLLALARDAQVDADVRSAAAWALGQLGRPEDKVLEVLLAAGAGCPGPRHRALRGVLISQEADGEG